MQFEKKVIINIPQVYSVDILDFVSHHYIGAGSEGHYPMTLIDMENLSATQITGGPGGTMCMVAVPGNDKRIVSVNGLFPSFIGDEAAIYMHALSDSGWNTSRLLSLPFAHRCEVLKHDDEIWLFAASVSKYKDNPDDWSRPGELYIIPLKEINDPDMHVKPVVDNLTRNHGMTRRRINGNDAICISGAEGIIEITREKSSEEWNTSYLFKKEVSEFVLFDIDNDGFDELITIEPFHGDSLNFYRINPDGWNLYYRSELAFGHGLSAGMFKGVPVVTAGNRKGSGSLELYYVDNITNGNIVKKVIEEGTGTTQSKIFKYKSTYYILSSNQAKNEVALYY